MFPQSSLHAQEHRHTRTGLGQWMKMTILHHTNALYIIVLPVLGEEPHTGLMIRCPHTIGHSVCMHYQDLSHIDLIEFAEVHGLEAIDGRPDVLAVATFLDQLQLPDT